MNLKQQLKELCHKAATNLWPEHQKQFTTQLMEVSTATKKEFGHYQCNAAMKLSKILRQNPRTIADNLKTELKKLNDSIFAEINIAGPGFINFVLAKSYLNECANKQIIDPKLGVISSSAGKKVIIDYSSPNIAKEMHVGHLRSTIIGACIAKVLKFLDYNILPLNHIGDWGTQFGMLINYLKKHNLIASLETISLAELVNYYKAAKQEFDADPDFKKQAQQEVVKLQQGEQKSKTIWEQLCAISMANYQEIYNTLDINLITRGESFYNPMLENTVLDLKAKNLVKESDGAQCVFLDGFLNREGAPQPLIIQKSDGGYNYATTDLAALKHRVIEEQGDWLIYVTDAGQAQHFSMIFSCAKLANYFEPTKTRVDHVTFGLVLKEDGKKFKTREGDTKSLQSLIDNAVTKAAAILKEREPETKDTEINAKARILGINAIKYADLANNRNSNYIFSYDKMLQFEGNTAAFLSYAYVRILSIQKKANFNNTNLKINAIEDKELELIVLALQFPEICEQFEQDLLPNRICDYLYKLAETFHSFFHDCQVIGSEYENSRLAICELIRIILAQGFSLLGLTTMDRM